MQTVWMQIQMRIQVVEVLWQVQMQAENESNIQLLDIYYNGIAS